MITLVLGGARSGKSTYAEKLIEDLGGGLYLATAQIWDDEMKERIQLHQNRRKELWRTLEEPIEIAPIIAKTTEPLLIDCLTLWLSNLMMQEECDIEAHLSDLIEKLDETEQDIVLVANEVGLGIVPENALARRFRDWAGKINQEVAKQADTVVFIAAGLPLTLKGHPTS